jgi:SAM-dependent methyltransferase
MLPPPHVAKLFKEPNGLFFMLRTRKIIGHGEGVHAKKAVDLSLKKRHARTEITATDLSPSRYSRYLLEKGAKEKPANLTVLGRTNSLNYLRALKNNSTHHQWAHFSVSNMGYSARRAFFKEVFRTLVPNGRLLIVDSAAAAKEFSRELSSFGFEVTVKRLSIDEARKLDTPDTHTFLAQNVQIARMMSDYGGRIPPQMFEIMKQNWIKFMLANEKERSKESFQSLQRMANDLQESMGERPFVRIIAKKPVKK